jgi:hypothetical protein
MAATEEEDELEELNVVLPSSDGLHRTTRRTKAERYVIAARRGVDGVRGIDGGDGGCFRASSGEARQRERGKCGGS